MVRLISVLTCLATFAIPAQAAQVDVASGELKAALLTAAPGDTLRLLPGVHSGPITIDLPLRLEGAPGAVLEGPGVGTVLILTADGITITGLTVRGSGNDLAQDEAVILIKQAQNVTIENCHVEARAFGIYLESGGGHHIRGNEVLGDTSLRVARRGNGIHLWQTENNKVLDNLLVDVRDGVYLSFAHDNVIRGNRGRGLRYGIHYMYSERNTLSGNHFSDGIGGIALMFSMRNQIDNNDTFNNRDFGILCQQIENSHIEGNRALGNGRGFYLENSAINQIVDNRLEANGVGVYLTAGSEQNVFTHNHFVGNLVQVFEDHPGINTFFDQQEGNFWSDYAGFDWNGDGIGETPYRLNSAASALMARRPIARWFWMSPALSLLEWWDTHIPSAKIQSFDPFPLIGSKVDTQRVSQ